jgi:hypothetical protein
VEDTQAARALANAKHPGTVLITTQGNHAGTVIKAYRLDADDDAARLDELAEAAGHTRPAPDEAARDAMGADYTDRWHHSDLYQLLLAQHQGVPASALALEQPAPAAPPEPVQADQPARGVVQTADVADQFRAITSGLADLSQEPSNPRNRMYSLLAERPTWGLSVMEIGAQLAKENIGVARQTIHRWLDEDIKAGRIKRSGQPGSAGARYLMRRDGGQD